ncbi:hypothetical protein Q7C36_000005 [Tachysurus vachellii]|uniref:RING-type domain-containing protein n=1 Tax=Tachysurus vachellii TaxID=175792 RepID=A0AA88P962_TACVA|nr:hypothetical protein Q7C36_000005 [Tachysurus vachellii]
MGNILTRIITEVVNWMAGMAMADQLERERERQHQGPICNLCFGIFSGQIYRLQCNHFVHGQCIEPWLRQFRRCPICHQAIRNGI